MFERILVPLDGSPFSGRALPYGIEIAKRFDAEVILLRVVPPTHVLPVSPMTIEMGVQPALRAKQYLWDKFRQVAAQGVKGSCHVVLGDPTESILEFCRKESVGLIIMTTHGRSGFKRAVLGSVTDKVIRATEFPVLVIRPRMAINT